MYIFLIAINASAILAQRFVSSWLVYGDSCCQRPCLYATRCACNERYLSVCSTAIAAVASDVAYRLVAS